MPGLTCWCECQSVLTLCEAPGPILPFGNEIGETMLGLEAKRIHGGLGAKAQGSIVRSTWRYCRGRFGNIYNILETFTECFRDVWSTIVSFKGNLEYVSGGVER